MENSGELLPPQIRDFDAATEAKIVEFTQSEYVKPYLEARHDKYFIARYLRARKNVVGDAAIMFRDTMKWKEEMKVDEIRKTFPSNPHFERLLSYWPGSLHWTDPPRTQDGSLVLLEALGKADPSIVEFVGHDTLIKYHIWCMEGLEEIYWKTVAEKGYWPGFVMIEDLNGVGSHTFSASVLKVAQEITKINQNYYPEMLRKMYILNVPSIFYMFWKGIQLWMEPRSVAKMELLNSKFTTSTISEKFPLIFDLSTLPARLGGTAKVDIAQGGYIPVPTTMKSETHTKVDIARGTKYEIKHNFEVGDLISWEFKIKDHDIGFNVCYKDKNNSVEMYKNAKCLSKKVHSGNLAIENAGTYLFTWDNSASWTRTKYVKFNIYKGNDVILSK